MIVWRRVFIVLMVFWSAYWVLVILGDYLQMTSNKRMLVVIPGYDLGKPLADGIQISSAFHRWVFDIDDSLVTDLSGHANAELAFLEANRKGAYKDDPVRQEALARALALPAQVRSWRFMLIFVLAPYALIIGLYVAGRAFLKSRRERPHLAGGAPG